MSEVALSCLLVVVAAAPPKGSSSGSGKEIPIISYENAVGHDGTYKYSFESGDGTKAQQSGQVVGENSVITGSYSYVGLDGNTYTITYTADENGFAPQGAHLPVAPPIPEAIARSIEYNLAHPEEDKSQK
ncbi:hypothetical protein C0J52_20616 [Blattella germanica]|nr:hypothetical protein C0J52_20616 [Blattella germanica]